MCIISVRILIIVTVSIQFGIIYFRFRSVFVLRIFSVIVILIVNGMDYFQFDLSFPLTNITLMCTTSGTPGVTKWYANKLKIKFSVSLCPNIKTRYCKSVLVKTSPQLTFTVSNSDFIFPCC